MAVISRSRSGDATHEYGVGDVDIVDLLLALWSRRRLALTTFLIVFVLGVAFSLKLSMKRDLSPQNYMYSSALQVGWPDTSLSTAKWLLENKYVPKALADYVSQHPNMKKKLSISVAIPPGSSLVVLEGVGLEGELGAYSFVVRQALRGLVADNQSLPEDSPFRLVLREVGEQTQKIQSSPQHYSVSVLVAISVVVAIFSSLISVIVAGLILQVHGRLRGIDHA